MLLNSKGQEVKVGNISHLSKGAQESILRPLREVKVLEHRHDKFFQLGERAKLKN